MFVVAMTLLRVRFVLGLVRRASAWLGSAREPCSRSAINAPPARRLQLKHYASRKSNEIHYGRTANFLQGKRHWILVAAVGGCVAGGRRGREGGVEVEGEVVSPGAPRPASGVRWRRQRRAGCSRNDRLCKSPDSCCTSVAGSGNFFAGGDTALITRKCHYERRMRSTRLAALFRHFSN